VIGKEDGGDLVADEDNDSRLSDELVQVSEPSNDIYIRIAICDIIKKKHPMRSTGKEGQRDRERDRERESQSQ
jgi:hypothetical protein